jgi:hypothetical protein
MIDNVLYRSIHVNQPNRPTRQCEAPIRQIFCSHRTALLATSLTRRPYYLDSYLTDPSACVFGGISLLSARCGRSHGSKGLTPPLRRKPLAFSPCSQRSMTTTPVFVVCGVRRGFASFHANLTLNLRALAHWQMVPHQGPRRNGRRLHACGNVALPCEPPSQFALITDTTLHEMWEREIDARWLAGLLRASGAPGVSGANAHLLVQKLRSDVGAVRPTDRSVLGD